MGGVESFEDISDDQLEGKAGGPTLQSETAGVLKVCHGDKTSWLELWSDLYLVRFLTGSQQTRRRASARHVAPK